MALLAGMRTWIRSAGGKLVKRSCYLKYGCLLLSFSVPVSIITSTRLSSHLILFQGLFSTLLHSTLHALCFASNFSLLITFSFAPSIVQSLGFTASRAQLMSVPPFAVAFVRKHPKLLAVDNCPYLLLQLVIMIFGYISDRYHCRGLVSTFASLLCVIGFGMFLGMFPLSV